MIGGKSIDGGLPVEIEVTSDEVYETVKPKLDEILACIMRVLELTPPELSGDITDTGIILTGGTAKMFGMSDFISEHTGVDVLVADEPEDCAVQGIGILLDDMHYLDRNGYIFKSASVDNTEDGE